MCGEGGFAQNMGRTGTVQKTETVNRFQCILAKYFTNHVLNESHQSLGDQYVQMILREKLLST